MPHYQLEEIILFQIQQHIMELGESGKLLQVEKEAAAAEAEILRKKCQDAERAIDKAKAQRIWCKSQILFLPRPRYPFSTCPDLAVAIYFVKPDRRFHLSSLMT